MDQDAPNQKITKFLLLRAYRISMRRVKYFEKFFTDLPPLPTWHVPGALLGPKASNCRGIFLGFFDRTNVRPGLLHGPAAR
jgi:hypothetical protein